MLYQVLVFVVMIFFKIFFSLQEKSIHTHTKTKFVRPDILLYFCFSFISVSVLFLFMSLRTLIRTKFIIMFVEK